MRGKCAALIVRLAGNPRGGGYAGQMARTLVTGMSGVGKSTLLAELARRGHDTVDTDYGDWESPIGFWDETRMAALLERERDVVVSGTVTNQGAFYDRFEYVVLLSAPVEVLIARVSTRTNNPYGRAAEEQTEIRKYFVEVEPLLRTGATIECGSADNRARDTQGLPDAVIESCGGDGE